MYSGSAPATSDAVRGRPSYQQCLQQAGNPFRQRSCLCHRKSRACESGFALACAIPHPFSGENRLSRRRSADLPSRLRNRIRLAELSLSFPALLAAVAHPRAGIDRQHVMDMVIEGLPLASVAERAGTPLWLRRMPPQFVVVPVPELADSPFLRPRIVDHFPRRPHQSAQWFAAVSEGGRWVHDEFALWCAQNFAVPAAKPPHIRTGAL